MNKLFIFLLLICCLLVTTVFAAYQMITIVDRDGDQIQVSDAGALSITF